MKFDGRAYAQDMYESLKQDVHHLKEQGVTPCLAVILVGQNPNSLSYIKQKRKWGKYIDAEIIVYEYAENTSEETLLYKISELNADTNTHGIIVQLPLPSHLDEKKLVSAVSKEKDIDGFHIDSPFSVPVAQAVWSILRQVHPDTFDSWIEKQTIVVLGKGKTAGAPIIQFLQKQHLNPRIIDHATENPAQLIKLADIVISCVGKVILTPDEIKPEALLIGVGLHLNEERKLTGDFIEEEIADHVSFYTPTPGGVGPVNVACLLQNLITAAKNLAS
jgi:methylenetetrahydrofolate dehydrogenase (NADP+)/methenyltetrahydrofolate cyclohydrolase